MPKMQTTCPNCQQPIVADVNQVFDVGENPAAKEQLLSGMFNIVSCPSCGYQGQLPTPVVYHDPEKELLLTYTPTDMKMSMQERENALAPLLKSIIDNLPPEKRKGYLFQSETMLTLRAMIERVLEADGITKEMLENQEKKMRLIQHLVSAPDEEQMDIIRENDELIDQEFFALFSRVAQSILLGGNKEGVEKLQVLQEKLLDETEFGRLVKKEAQELEAARNSLSQLGQDLNRDTLLELVIQAPGEERVSGLTSLARPLMDYTFFQKFTERIEQTEGEQRKKLVNRRNQILKQVEEIDQRVEERMQLARQNVETLIKSKDITRSVRENLSAVDDFFIQALSDALEKARQDQESERLEKLQEVLDTIEELSTPPEMAIIETLLEYARDPELLKQKIQEMGDQIDSGVVDTLTNLVGRVEENLNHLEGEQKEKQQAVYEDLKKVYKAVVRSSMETKFKTGK